MSGSGIVQSQVCASSGVTVWLRKPSPEDQTPSIDDLAEWAELAYAAFPNRKVWGSIAKIVCITPNAEGAPQQFQGPLPWDGFTDVSAPQSVIYLNGETANYRLLLHELGHCVARAMAEVIAENFKAAFMSPGDARQAEERAWWLSL